MKNKIVHKPLAYWLYVVRIKTSRVSVLGIYMTSRYMHISKLIFYKKFKLCLECFNF